MSSASLKNGLELRQLIRTSPTGATIHLDAGCEYQGPLLIDKPITIIGHGSQTPFFSKSGPPLIILATGARLEQMEISGYYGISVLAASHTDPTHVNVNLIGRIETMAPDQVIDMGDMLPKQQAYCFFEVEVTGPGVVKYSENSAKWLRVGPEILPVGGKHLIQVVCDTKLLGAGAMAVGNIELETNVAKQSFWVMVNVLPEAASNLLTGPIVLRQRNNHLICFGDSLLLGKNGFSDPTMTGNLAERQAVILTEAAGTWALFTPWQTSLPTLVNGKPLWQGQRLLLHKGNTISIGDFESQVEQLSPTCLYYADTMNVDLGILGKPSSDRKFQVRYKGATREKVQFQTKLPWLRVTPTETEISPGETFEIKLEPTQATNYLPMGKQRERSAIFVQGLRETLVLDVNYETTATKIIPRIAGPLRFGTISDWSYANAMTTIYNDGSVDWQPTVKVDREWLTPESDTLLVAAGQSTQLMINLNDKVRGLPFATDHTAIVVLEGDELSVPVQVSLRLRDPNALLDIVPSVVDLKSIDDWPPNSLPVGTLKVKNVHNKPVILNTRTTLTWLAVEPEQKECLPGKTETLNVRIKPEEALKGVRKKSYSISDAIIIQTQGKDHFVGLMVDILKVPASPGSTNTVNLLPLDFSLSMPVIDLGDVNGLGGILPTCNIRLFHNQSQPINVSVSSQLPWLKVMPSAFVCGPEGYTFTVSIVKEEAARVLRVKSYDVADGILIEAGGVKKNIPIRLNLRSR